MIDAGTDSVTAYARSVVDGVKPAGKWHRRACERHLRDLQRNDWGWTFKFSLAKRAFEFFSLFRHYKGREWVGRPIYLEDWQQFIVGSLLGWVDESGLRRFRNAFIELPRGQGKSTMAGGLLVLLTFFDDEAGAEGYSVATKKDQARITFQAGRQMVLRSSALRDHISVSKYNLHSAATESKMEALGADADTLDGLRPHIVVADEVHKHPSPDLIEVVESGMGTRLQPLLVEITTAGKDDDAGIYAQHYLLSTRILDQVVELDEWFTFIAAADPDDDWTLESTWAKANPNFGISIRPDHMRKECRKALANPPEQAKFRRLYLGQKSQLSEGYFSVDDWKACPPLPEDVELARYPCWVGVDLSSTVDVTAAVIVWRISVDEIAVKPFFWLPTDNLEDRARRDRIPYALYVEQGWLSLTEGNTVDRVALRPLFRSMMRERKARGLCYDPWHAAEMMQNMKDEDHVRVLPVAQTFQILSQPMKDLQAMILRRRVRHDENPLMTIMVANVVKREDEKSNVMPSKRKSRGRIDGVSATLNVLSQRLTAPIQRGVVGARPR